MVARYLKVTIICRYIFLQFGLKSRFVSTKFCYLYTEVIMVQGRQYLLLMFSGTKFCVLGQSAEISNISTHEN